MLELILFLLIASILAVGAIVLYQPDDIKARYEAERLASDLRHMQMIALTKQQSLRFEATAGTPASYRVCTPPGAGCTTITDPATGAPFQVTLEANITLSSAPSSNVDMDSLGRPLNGAAFATANNVFTLSGGGTSYTVTVRPLTGFATVP